MARLAGTWTLVTYATGEESALRATAAAADAMIEIRIFRIVAFLKPCGYRGNDTECDDEDNNHDDPLVVAVPPATMLSATGVRSSRGAILQYAYQVWGLASLAWAWAFELEVDVLAAAPDVNVVVAAPELPPELQ